MLPAGAPQQSRRLPAAPQACGRLDSPLRIPSEGGAGSRAQCGACAHNPFATSSHSAAGGVLKVAACTSSLQVSELWGGLGGGCKLHCFQSRPSRDVPCAGGPDGPRDDERSAPDRAHSDAGHLRVPAPGCSQGVRAPARQPCRLRNHGVPRCPPS